MELQQLRYVVAVAEEQNFSRAAERCHVTQPSLSQQIINLEKDLGHKLFHRLGRNAVLTEAGKAFLLRARRILLEVDDATREIKDSNTLDRRIRVGAIPSLAPSLFPQILALCRNRFPNLQIETRENFRDDLIAEVLNGVLDLAIVALPVAEPNLSVEPLISEPLMLVVGKNHPLASKPKVSIEDIKLQPFIVMGSASTLTSDIQRFCGDNQFEPIITHRLAQITTVKALVAQGEGITIMPLGTISAEDRTRIVTKPLESRKPSRDLGVIRHQMRYQSHGVEQFLTVLRSHLGLPAKKT